MKPADQKMMIVAKLQRLRDNMAPYMAYYCATWEIEEDEDCMFNRNHIIGWIDILMEQGVEELPSTFMQVANEIWAQI